jgi:NADH:ubiquinone oxidoreductase subunit F (NADH-binding)
MSAATRRGAVSRVAPPAGASRLLETIRADGHPLALGDHVRRWGSVPVVRGRRGRLALIDVVSESGLTGRGGAGFPVARKLEAVAAGRSRPVVVANGAEGEPPSGKDKVLLGYVPHLVLDGAVLAAGAVGAREVVVATTRSSRDAVVHAIAERRRAGIDGGVALRAIRVPETFVAGEETAVVRYLNGGPALPTFVPPRPFERGVGGAPTLVQNVETLAHLALVARFGPQWFRAVGPPAEPGSVLVTLSGAVRHPGVQEVPLGMPLGELLAQAGGATSELRALLVGGYFGTWLTAEEARATPLSTAGLAPLGAALGARAIVALPSSSCGLCETARVVRWLARESAGQCGPCVHGLAAISSDLLQVARGEGRAGAWEALLRRLPQVEGRGACRHPDGAVRLVRSALRVFAGEAELHLARGLCASRSEHPVLPLPSRGPEAVA